MNQITKTRIARIAELHAEIGGIIRVTLDKAIEIGGLLAEQKAETAHGKWEPWVSANLPFTARTASRYMRAHENRDRIKSDSVSDLTDAYRMLEEPVVRKPPDDRIGKKPAAPPPPPPAQPPRSRVGTPVNGVIVDDDPFAISEPPDTGAAQYARFDVTEVSDSIISYVDLIFAETDPTIHRSVLTEVWRRVKERIRAYETTGAHA